MIGLRYEPPNEKGNNAHEAIAASGKIEHIHILP
jgi:hypothetical protein